MPSRSLPHCWKKLLLVTSFDICHNDSFGKIRRIGDYINIDSELDSLDLILCYGFSRKADAFV